MKQFIWFDGKFIDFDKAKVHILTHSLQYGSGIFEGIRSYKTSDNVEIFRLDDHIDRFFNSAKIYNMKINFDKKEIKEAIIELIKKNKLNDSYIRPFLFYNDIHIGVSPFGKNTSVGIAAIPFGNYFENKNKGIRCMVSSWRRIESEILPPEAKASGNYLNSILASIEARYAGFDEAIMLSREGYVAEGPGENIFLIKDNKLITPSKDADILLGITRDSIITIAKEDGIDVEERLIHREELYTADEVFFCGTAAEITPIIEIDSRKIGNGKIGSITKRLLSLYESIIRGNNKMHEDWLTFVY